MTSSLKNEWAIKEKTSTEDNKYTHTQHTTVLRLCGICPGKPG